MIKKHRYKTFLFIFLCFFSTFLTGQQLEKTPFFAPADTFNSNRFWGSAITGTTIFTSAVIGLNEIWYAQYPRSKFHTFNDAGEWEDMDKAGHFMTAYIESNWCFTGAQWTGLKRRKAMWLAAALGMSFQASIEILDGFSEEWGFSLHDMAFNTLGASTFVAQELIWQEQRIVMKVSNSPINYPEMTLYSKDGSQTTTLKERASDLYGTAYTSTFMKDYNAQTLWASANIYSFLNNKESKFPKWLNVAVGYGAQNMYGGFVNSWEVDGMDFKADKELYPRYRQFYLSFDIDLRRIKTKNHFLKTLFTIFNVIKIPAPTLEINTLGNFKFHPIYF